MLFMPAVRGRNSQYFLRPPAPDVIVREEAGEMLADDLLGLIPFDSLGAGIPSDDMPRQVQHQDGVIVNFVEERSILVLAIPLRRLRQPASGAVADDSKARNGGSQQTQGGSQKSSHAGRNRAHREYVAPRGVLRDPALSGRAFNVRSAVRTSGDIPVSRSFANCAAGTGRLK